MENDLTVFVCRLYQLKVFKFNERKHREYTDSSLMGNISIVQSFTIRLQLYYVFLLKTVTNNIPMFDFKG